MTEIIGLHHVQLAMPAGQEGMARAFYSGVLGLFEEPKPANLATRGGVWFRGGETGLHLGVDAEFRMQLLMRRPEIASFISVSTLSFAPPGRRTRRFWSEALPSSPSGAEPPGTRRSRTNRWKASTEFTCSTALAIESSCWSDSERSFRDRTMRFWGGARKPS